MMMKEKVLDYIEEQNISVELLRANTRLRAEIFDRENGVDWSAEELLVVCAYLQLEPMELYG